MQRLTAFLLFGFVCGCGTAFSQDLTPRSGIKIPDLKPNISFDWSNSKNTRRPGFLKNLTIESFGYSSKPIPSEFEFPVRLTEGAFTAHGLQCPFCVIRPTMERARYSLPEFGATGTLSFWNGRAALFAQIGGVNAWKPDGVRIQAARHGGFSTSSNDAWLVQGAAGVRVAVDPGRHVWLGGESRYLRNFGPDNRVHWNSYSGGATFVFGR